MACDSSLGLLCLVDLGAVKVLTVGEARLVAGITPAALPLDPGAEPCSVAVSAA